MPASSASAGKADDRAEIAEALLRQVELWNELHRLTADDARDAY